jgi:DNA-binding Xre family transcriptional regulator
MLKNPREAVEPRLPAKKPPTPKPEVTQAERVSASPYPRAKVLMGEVAAPPQQFAAIGGKNVEIGQQRQAFRAFMTARHLRPTEWARAAGVAPGEILGFLTAKTRTIAPATLEKLAQAVRCKVEDFFK